MQEKKRSKRIRSNSELSLSIRKKKSQVNVLNTQIKDKSIKKNKLLSLIDEDIDELTSRFKD